MPQAGDEEHGELVEIPARPRHAAAAHREIHIVLEPARQRDVPALGPELRYRAREIGPAEILHQPIAENGGEPDGHVGIAEKSIDLERVEIDGDDERHGRLEIGIGEGGVHHFGEPVGDHHLLNRPHSRSCRPSITRAVETNTGPELAEERPGALDRTGDQLGRRRHRAPDAPDAARPEWCGAARRRCS